MTVPILKISEVLELQPFEEGGPDHFIGQSSWRFVPSVFGGHLIGQAVAAASRTVMPDRHIHSLHAYYARAGALDEPIVYAVERIQDGGSFSRRRVQATQNGALILSAIASFHIEEPGLAHHTEMPTGLPGPEGLARHSFVLEGPNRSVGGAEVNFDVRHIEGDGVFELLGGEDMARRAAWIRVAEPLPDDSEATHRAALAYASDHVMITAPMIYHNVDFTMPGLSTTSLDHAMWWHAPRIRVDDWLLYVYESPQSGYARGLAAGRMYTPDGVLVATIAQETMMRLPAEALAAKK